MKPKLLIVTLLIISLLIFSAAAYYYRMHDDAIDAQEGMLTDADCALLNTDEARNACCATAHKNDFTIACVGNWQYVTENSRCEYICDTG